MIDRALLSKLLCTNRQYLQHLQDTKILVGTRIGNKYVYSKEQILRFQKDYEGLDLSNVNKMKEAYQQVNCNKSLERSCCVNNDA